MYPDTHGSWMCIKQNKWSMDCLLYEGRVLDIADNSVSTAEGQSMEKRAIERNKSWAACQLVVLVKQTRRISLRKNHGHRKARSHSSRPSSSSAWKCGYVSSTQSIWSTNNRRPTGKFPLSKKHISNKKPP